MIKRFKQFVVGALILLSFGLLVNTASALHRGLWSLAIFDVVFVLINVLAAVIILRFKAYQ